LAVEMVRRARYGNLHKPERLIFEIRRAVRHRVK